MAAKDKHSNWISRCAKKEKNTEKRGFLKTAPDQRAWIRAWPGWLSSALPDPGYRPTCSWHPPRSASVQSSCNRERFPAVKVIKTFISSSLTKWQNKPQRLSLARQGKAEPTLIGKHLKVNHYKYHIRILVYFTVGSTSSGSAFIIAPSLGAKTIFKSISLWKQLLPLYFLIQFPDRISHTFVLFKDVTLTWINYLETWLCSDNTSCYYISVSSDFNLK